MTAIDGIGRSRADVARSDIDHLAFCTGSADTHDTIRRRTNPCKAAEGGPSDRRTGFGSRSPVSAAISKHHAVGLTGSDRVANHKGIICRNRIVVAECITARSANDIRVAESARVVPGHLVPSPDCNSIVARCRSPLPQRNGTGTRCPRRCADSHGVTECTTLYVCVGTNCDIAATG